MRISDWSSDVCSSDLRGGGRAVRHGNCGPPHLLRAGGAGAGGDCRGAGRRSAVGVRRARTRATIRYVSTPQRRGDTHVAMRARKTASPAGSGSEEHTSELQSLMRISYAVFCLKKKKEQ